MTGDWPVIEPVSELGEPVSDWKLASVRGSEPVSEPEGSGPGG